MLKKKKVMPIPSINGSHCMTWRELAEADDYATALIVDPFLGFKTHKMTDIRIRISERIQNRLKNTINQFQKDKDYELAYSNLTEDDICIKKQLRNNPRFRQHIYRYLLLFDDRSGIQIRPCWRYASEAHVGAAIFATKDWPKGSRVDSLIGCIAELNYEEEVSFLRHKQNDYSVMYSSRKNRSQLWLGPAAYVNHDCQPNCEFTINCDGDARMSLEVRKDVKKGDEIFIFYGKHFFDVNNGSCECFTCELLGTGFFSSESIQPQNPMSTGDRVSMHQNTSTSEDENIEKQNSDLHKGTPNDGIVQTLRERLQQIPASRHISNGVGRIFSEMQLLPSPNRRQRSDNAADHLTPASMNGLLAKGISTGLAQRSSTNYSLRHTGSRMDRVKATIYLELAASLAATSKKATPTLKKKPRLVMVRHSLPLMDTSQTPTRYPLRSRPGEESLAPSFATQKPIVLTDMSFPAPTTVHRRRTMATAPNNRRFSVRVQKPVRIEPHHQQSPDSNKIVSVQIVSSESVSVFDQEWNATSSNIPSLSPPELDPMEEPVTTTTTTTTTTSSSSCLLNSSPAFLERGILFEGGSVSSGHLDCLSISDTCTPLNVEQSPTFQNHNIDSMSQPNFNTWNFEKSTNCVPSPTSPAISISSTSTIAAAATHDDLNIPPILPLKRRHHLTNYDAQLIANEKPPSPHNAYYLRQRKFDLTLSPTCSVSSGDTCPAVAEPSPRRLLLVCKRSFKSAASSTNSVISSSSECEWFVDDTHPSYKSRRERRRRNESRVSLPGIFPSTIKPCSSSRSSCLTCYSLATPEIHPGDTDRIFILGEPNWSPVELSPSPPHLQPATPPPPHLGDAEEVDFKPLTVKIKRLGQQLYCIPMTPENQEEKELVIESTVT